MREEEIINSTCDHFNSAVVGKTYTCSVENAACNFVRSTTRSNDESFESDNACLEVRHSRFMIIALAVVSAVLVALYAAHRWVVKGKEVDDETAERRVRALDQDD